MGKNRPNIIILMVDDLRHDCLGVAPEKRWLKRYRTLDLLSTPTMDQLASEGVYFTQAVSTATETPPSVASMLTGCWGPLHGIRALFGGPMNKEVKTLWQHLERAGYDSAACDPHGFMEFNGTLDGCRLVLHSKWETERHQRIVKQLSESLKPPFALYMHLWDVHRPYLISSWPYKRHQPFIEFLERLADDYLLPRPPFPFSRLSPADLRDYWMNIWADILHKGKANSVETQVPLYVQGVSAFDQGRLNSIIHYLNNFGMLDNSILVLVSDHGETVNWKFAKSQQNFEHSCFPNEGVMRVPMIIRAPGILPEGKVVDNQVSTADILPTILELAGVEPLDSPISGRSLLGTIGGDGSNSTGYCEYAATDPICLAENFDQKCIKAKKNLEFEWLIMYRAIRVPGLKFIEYGEPLTTADLEKDNVTLAATLLRKRNLYFENDPYAQGVIEQARTGELSRKEMMVSAELNCRLYVTQVLYDLNEDPDEMVNLLGLDRKKFWPLAEQLRNVLDDISKATINPTATRSKHGEKDAAEVREMAEKLRGLGYLD